jgi:murein DD-endopeptidase MepM/ murein hydrolase activator NlpD
MTAAGTIDLANARGGRWPSLLALPAVAVLLFAASSPSVAQALPRFFFPAVALVGAVASTITFVRALLRRRTLPRLVVSLIAFVVLAVLPLVRLVGLLAAPSSGPPYILAAFGDWLGGEGYPHPGRHRGLDIKGPVGSDVLAAADGRVVAARDTRDLCGLIVAIVHEPYGYRTVYCHFATLLVRPGDEVRRGQRIGTLGTTGQRAWPGYEHVHLELQRGTDRNDVEDPMPRLAGCFEARASYPADRLVLTYPVACREGERR